MFILNINVSKDIDYNKFYREKFKLEKKENYIEEKTITQDVAVVEELSNDKLKERLIEFRKFRSNSMNIPAYYVFTNDELDRLVEVKPKTLDELKDNKILSAIKFKTHGEQIIEIINKPN